jgi:hypothetical protein
MMNSVFHQLNNIKFKTATDPVPSPRPKKKAVTVDTKKTRSCCVVANATMYLQSPHHFPPIHLLWLFVPSPVLLLILF